MELIETLWNVNKIIAKIIKPAVKELIETLWNVNIPPYIGCVMALTN